VPDDRSIIVASEFASAEALAAHLHALNADDAAYASMLKLKTNGKISNSNLIDALKDRSWGEGGEDNDRENFVESFECFLCRQVSQKRNDERRGYSRSSVSADSTHFGCHSPVNPVTRSVDVNSWWYQLWRQARIEADVIRHFVSLNRNFSSDEFHAAVIERFH
jgi:alpha-1,3-fucosyltransferase 10